MNSTVPTATVAGTDQPDHAPNSAVENNSIELSTNPNFHGNFNSAMNNSKAVPGDPPKSHWVQFDDDDDFDENHTSSLNSLSTASPLSEVGAGAGPLTSIPMQSTTTSVAGTSTQHETVTTVGLLPPPAQTNKHSTSEVAPAVLATESVHVNLNNSSSATSTPKNHTASNSIGVPKVNAATQKNASSPPISTPPATNDMGQMRTVELTSGRVREGFANGDVIVTLLPVNTKLPWITPAVFRPELVPEELMAQGLTLTVEEYVNAMETLVNDYRFTLYNVCYKRVLVCWILFAFSVLLALLFSGLQGIALFSLGVGWLFLNAAAIFLCMWIKLKLSRGLEKCLARVNRQLARHKILLVLDDRGRISCHKVNLCFLYFDPAQCIAYLNTFLERSEQNGTTIDAGWESRLDLDVTDIVIQGSNTTRLSRKQALAQEILLTYLQRWGKDFLRRRLDWTVNEDGTHEMPRHLMSSICPCQYVEEILNNKIKVQLKRNCCGLITFCKDFC